MYLNLSPQEQHRNICKDLRTETQLLEPLVTTDNKLRLTSILTGYHYASQVHHFAKCVLQSVNVFHFLINNKIILIKLIKLLIHKESSQRVAQTTSCQSAQSAKRVPEIYTLKTVRALQFLCIVSIVHQLENCLE